MNTTTLSIAFLTTLFVACGSGNPDSIKAMNEGIHNAQAGNYLDAVGHLERAVQIDGQNHKALGILGMVHMSMQKPEKARDDYRRAIAVAPEEANYHERLAEAAISVAHKKEAEDKKVRATAEWNEAKAELEKAVALDKERFRSHFLLGNTNEALENYQAALENYSTSIQSSPRFVTAYEFLGRLYADLDYPEQARAVLNEGRKVAISGTEEEAGIYRLLGAVSLAESEVNDDATRNTKLQEALASYKKELEIVPSNPSTLFAMGRVNEELGRTEEALRYYKKFQTVEARAPKKYKRIVREKVAELSTT